MSVFIQIKNPDRLYLNTELLGLNKAELWISPNPDGPADNDDERVLKERAEAEANQGKSGQRPSGISAVPLKESTNYPGWFEVDTSTWPAGIYRFNLHSPAGVEAPNGSKLIPIRDGEYSWPVLSDDYLQNLPEEQKQFLYLERNQAGFCMRIEIKSDRMIQPAGDGPDWIDNWPELKKLTEKQIESKLSIKQSKNKYF